MSELSQGTNTRVSVEQLIGLVQAGRILDAIDTYYAENVSMQENQNPPTVGKAVNRVREEAFVASVAEVHRLETPSVFVEGDQSAIHWILDYTTTTGERHRLDQIALQTWENGKIVSERFIYDPTAVVV